MTNAAIWPNEPLGRHVKIRSGDAPANLQMADNEGVPYVKVEDMNNCKKYQCVSRENVINPPTLIPANSIIFPKRGAAIMNNKVRIAQTEIAIDTNMMSLEALSTLDTEFLYYALTHTKLFKIADTSTIPQINNKHITPYRLPIPPLKEQNKIAEILSTWDRAIEATEKLIENSELQKKALMQQLLTGKKRLPGFEGEWTKTTLGDLGKTYTGLSGKTKADFGSGKPFVPYKNVFANAELYMNELEYVRLSDGEKQNMVKSGDIIFTTSSETPEEVGMSSAVLADIGELYLNSFCFGYRIKKQNEFIPSFAKHLFRSSELRRAISSLAQGSTRYNLSKNEFLKISIQLPTRVEQERIVEVLDDVATAHSAEQKKLQKLKAEKSALMQQLLTGKRRVAINKEEAVV